MEKEKQEEAILAIDKLKKVGVDEVRKELEGKGVSDDSIARLIILFNEEDESNESTIQRLDSILTEKEGIKELKETLEYARLFGVKNIKLDPGLARGLSYYTGTVLEVYLNNNSISSSLAAGGRFDKMIGNFLGLKEEVPAVGMSFGLDVISDALKINKKIETKKSVVEVYIIPLKTEKECVKICQKIRSFSINCEMDLTSKSVTKNLDYANKLNIPFVSIVGEDEIKQNKIKLKNMKTGKEKMIKVDEIRKEMEK